MKFGRPTYRGRKKPKIGKPITWVASSRCWHRVDPTNGAKTACGYVIGPSWGFPYMTTTGKPPVLSIIETKELCKIPECRGI